MESMILVLQKLRVLLGIALCLVGIAGTVVPVIPGVPIILAGVTLMGADHPLVMKAKANFKRWKAGRCSPAEE